MVPSAFVTLTALPLTANGKVDREALPAPTQEDRRQHTDFVEPRTDAEQTLARVWVQVLGVARVGRNDRFFDLGGNSLSGVRMVALANQAGLSLRVRQLFQHPTLEALAAASTPQAPPPPAIARPHEDLEATLLPHQQWLVETFDMETQVWSLTMIWDLPARASVDLLRDSARWLCDQHEVLRLRLRRTPEGWRQRLLASGAEPQVEALDLSGLEPQAQRQAILDAGRRLQGSLSILRGPVLALALCRMGGTAPDKLILCIHHSVYDAYSRTSGARTCAWPAASRPRRSRSAPPTGNTSRPWPPTAAPKPCTGRGTSGCRRRACCPRSRCRWTSPAGSTRTSTRSGCRWACRQS
jgi:hypothetical protein